MMETVPAASQDDSSGANPSSVKSDDSSPRHESGRGSPPPNCAICLGTCRNKSFTDSCLHQFCFKCLLTWSKVKAECPLCKQNFRSIIHNVRSNHQYEEYMVEQRQTEETTERIDIDNLTTATRRFRYRTTLTLPRRESIAIQQLLLHYPIMADVFPPPAPPAAHAPRRSPASFRRTVYRHNLWARYLPDFTGRFRDCTAEFYRYNDSQIHRLVPWLNRELLYLLNENVGHISYVLARILELLPQYHIRSNEFREAMQRYFGDRTDHFLHELYCFASTPYDMTGYDRNVQYTTRTSDQFNEVISSTDSEASVDSDIMMISSSEPAEPPPGPSRRPEPVYPHQYIPPPTTANVIPIETISQSDTDDDSSVMVVGYIKPPQDRTPEVVDLLGSDSDVIVQDASLSDTPANVEVHEPTVPLVKVSLKRQSTAGPDSDSDSYRPSPRRRRRPRSLNSATTSDTCRTTPSPRSSRWESAGSSFHASSTSSFRTPSSSGEDWRNDDSSASSGSTDRRSRLSRTPRRKPKKKTYKERRDNEKERKKRRKSQVRQKAKKSAQNLQADKDKKGKRKSNSGKGVKSSKKRRSCTPPEPSANPDEPGPSGSSGHSRTRPERDRKRHRLNREIKRLKSVVNVMYSNKNAGDSSSSGNSNLLNVLNSAIQSDSGSGSVPSDERSVPSDERSVPSDERSVPSDERSVPSDEQSVQGDSSRPARPLANDSDSEDDELPLNLTVHKTYPFSSL